MSDEAVRQRYKLATGKGLDSPPAKSTGTPGFRRGGSVGKQAGGMTYSKGGSSKGKR